MPAPFDTHDAFQTLERAGIAADHADAITAVLSKVAESIASPLALKTDLDAMEGRVNLKLEAFEGRVNLTLSQLETKLETLRGEVKSEIAPLKWVGLVGVGGIITLVLKAFLLP